MTKHKRMDKQVEKFSAYVRELYATWFKTSQLSQKQLGDLMGWAGDSAQTSVSQYLLGKRDLDLDQAVRMAESLGHTFPEVVAAWIGKASHEPRDDARERRLLMGFRRASAIQQDALLAVAETYGVPSKPAQSGRARVGTRAAAR